jgi:hypothetical protein
MRYDHDSMTRVAANLALLAADEVAQLQRVLSANGAAHSAAAEACLAFAPSVLQKAIVANKTVPGDIALQLSGLALRAYEDQLWKRSDPKEQVRKGLLGRKYEKLEPQARYAKYKSHFENSWTIVREHGLDPFESIGIIILGCLAVDTARVETPDSVSAVRREIGAFISRVDAAMEAFGTTPE